MANANLDGAAITDWDSFHVQSRLAFGFPDFYANTMDAWVDCLSYLRDEDGMTKFRLKTSETLQITLSGAEQMRAQAPDILEEMIFCIAGINERYEDYGERPALVLQMR